MDDGRQPAWLVVLPVSCLIAAGGFLLLIVLGAISATGQGPCGGEKVTLGSGIMEEIPEHYRERAESYSIDSEMQSWPPGLSCRVYAGLGSPSSTDGVRRVGANTGQGHVGETLVADVDYPGWGSYAFVLLLALLPFPAAWLQRRVMRERASRQ